MRLRTRVHWCAECRGGGEVTPNAVVLDRTPDASLRSVNAEGRALLLSAFDDFPSALSAKARVGDVFDEHRYRALLKKARGESMYVSKVGGYPAWHQDSGQEELLIDEGSIGICDACEQPIEFLVQLANGPTMNVGGDLGLLTVGACVNPACETPLRGGIYDGA